MQLLHYCTFLVFLIKSTIECKRDINLSDYKMLRKTIFLYSAGQTLTFEKAFAFVLRNRIRANREEFGGKRIVDVCDQFWPLYALPEHLDMPEDVESEMDKWLPEVWNGRIPDFTKGSLYLQFPDENEGMNVQWTIGMEKTIEINGVKFYKD